MITARYIEAAVEGELARIRAAAPGGRARTVFQAAKSLGTLVGSGALSHDATEHLLIEAAVGTGLSAKDAAIHVRRGLGRGAEKPRPTHAPGGAAAPQRPASPPPAQSTAAAHRAGPPPQAEVERLWAACEPVSQDAVATAWCRGRGLDPEAIDLWDLARVIGTGSILPWWASCQRVGWSLSGHRLVVRVFDARGRFASVRARSIAATPTDHKELAPAGHSAAGLVLADPLAEQVLLAGPPAWWTDRAVVISEGTPDWLTWASRQSDAQEQGPACIGIGSGFWSPAIAARIPDGARIALRTHHDEAGNSFAKQVFDSLKGRCPVFRA